MIWFPPRKSAKMTKMIDSCVNWRVLLVGVPRSQIASRKKTRKEKNFVKKVETKLDVLNFVCENGTRRRGV